jgi:hypothetical protein
MHSDSYAHQCSPTPVLDNRTDPSLLCSCHCVLEIVLASEPDESLSSWVTMLMVLYMYLVTKQRANYLNLLSKPRRIILEIRAHPTQLHIDGIPKPAVACTVDKEVALSVKS